MRKQLGIIQQLMMSRGFLAAILLTSLLVVRAPSARGADLADQAHSLRSVPADTAFYSASLRLKEQLDKFLASRSYAKLMEIPLVQLAKMKIQFDYQQSPQPTIAKVREYFESPVGRDSIAVLKEMFSDEVFAYGAPDIADVIKLLMDLDSIGRSARIESATGGENPDEPTNERVMDELNKRVAALKVPTLVLGFRITDAARAKSQLDEVHSMLRNLLDEHKPEFSSHLQRDQVGGHEFLTLRLDGSMIPWKELEEKAEAEEEGETTAKQIEQWKKVISEKKLVAALGVVGDYVLLSVGDSTDHLEQFGKGPFLADNAAIKKLGKHADQKLVSIGFLSEALARSLSSPEQTVEDIAGGVEEALGAAKISEANRKLIIEDIRALDLKRYIPEPGETTSVAFLTDRGYEGFQYNSSKRPMMDSSRPLTILNHAGGTPALVIGARSKESVADYEKAVAWLKRTAPHVEKIAEEKVAADDWAKYQEFRDRIVALLTRLDTANRDQLLPALADGQDALVMDISATSKQWFEKMPESPKALPMPELGFVVSVTDAPKLRQGVKEYVAVVQDAIKLMHEIDPENAPDVEIPQPEQRDLPGGGDLYVYSLPGEWGVDEQVAVNAGLTDHVAVVSTMPATTERLVKETPLEVESGLKLDRPAALVVHVEVAKWIGTLRPWIDYGFGVAMGTLKPKNEEGEAEVEDEAPADPNPLMLQMGFVMPQVYQFLDAASALKSVSAVAYEEDGQWVTHSEMHFEDLK
jgi:hypothetical protein